MDFITRQRTVRAVQREAAARGFNGDIWADDVPELGTMRQEMAICDIAIDASPGPMNRWDFAFFKRLVRAAVLTSPIPLEPREKFSQSSTAPATRRPRKW